MNPYERRALALWFIFIVVGILGLLFYADLNVVSSVIIATNASTFFVMGFDKLQASTRGSRVPERTFYLMTLLGGSVGMLCGIYAFRHKTRKHSFQFFVALMILIQIGVFFALGGFDTLIKMINLSL